MLFVGNSLTYTNNLHALVEEVGKTHGIKITTALLAYPNYASRITGMIEIAKADRQ